MAPSTRRFLDALDQRIGYRKLVSLALDEDIPGGASWGFVLGSSALILFLIQLGTGVVLATYYSPSSTDAWASVAYIEQAIPLGSLVRGMHHHAASAMVVVVVLHMLQVISFGAYKAPREGNWLSGLAMFGLVLAFALTGYLLPWDQTGYWATKVATSIAGTVPVAGELIQKVLQGGNDYGNLTLTRFYAIHVIVLPIAMLALLGAHMALFRRHGVTPSPSKSDEDLEKIEKFWPKQVAYDAVFATAVVAVVASLGLFVGAPLQAPADPASNFIARPEWYFLFLFQLLKYFDGPLQIVGTVILPGLVTTFLVVLPFLDSGPSRRIRHRKPWVAAIALGFAVVAGLTALALRGDANDPLIQEQKELAHREAQRALAIAKDGVPAAGATYMAAHDPLIRGERVFRRECASCHHLEGRGPKKRKAPDLTGYRSRAWIRQVLRDPDHPRLFGATKVYGMEPLAELPEEDIRKLVDFVYSLRNKDAPTVEDTAAAELFETHECGNCHELEEYYGLEGPALYRYASHEWVTKVVAHAGSEDFYGDANDMPKFQGRISDEDRAAVVELLMTLEDRGSRDQWPWVDPPGPVPTPREDPTKTSSTAETSSAAAAPEATD